MNKSIVFRVALITLLLFSFNKASDGLTAQKTNTPGAARQVPISSGAIERSINVTKHFRSFPDLALYRNTSLQKATTPVLAKVSEDAFGKAKITRVWLNLDEMWDYRTREFNFNFQIGVDKYKEDEKKWRESWNWEMETPVRFYDYLKAFSQHSEELLLCIRRYERDILDKNLPVSFEDYKMIFKTGLIHYKMMFPNIRYVQVGNEYNGGSFMKASDDEYYLFFKLGYEAVNEVNEELGLEGADRILVGNSPPVGKFLERIESFFDRYNRDTGRMKRIDFISWHEYSKPIPGTAHREDTIKALLSKYSIPENLPFFITEHQPYHGSYKDKQLDHHMLNTAYMPKSLYFTSLYSPQVRIFPWVLYHNREIQTKFMWFDGPNEPDTKAFEMRMLPLGASVKMLSMHKGREIKVENSLDSDDLVLASVQKDRLVVQVINYASPRDVKISLSNIWKLFPEVKSRGQMQVFKYLIDSKHSNCLTVSGYPGGLEKAGEYRLETMGNDTVLDHKGLEENGLVLWEIIL